MPSSPDSAAGSDPALARRRFPGVVARVIVVQMATLIGLWLLNYAFGAP
jgi:hypothetical protein